ncbi:IS1380 family transposase [Oceanispirochaeta sp. M2]|nr:IS1380 family transposase [Oceanispirochaeta sp. M2]NPD74542.1 IS1380 family transposase [Oceanispirochaeta sp. M1]RDG29655.1 IS1380 family transposase [Oceanispirochaeta sp. M1]
MDFMINTTTDKLSSTGGMALVGKILERIKFGKRVKPIGLKHLHVLKSIVGLYTQGRTSFEEIDLFREDSFFRDSFDLKYVPAKETVRLYLEKMIPEKSLVNMEIEKSSIELLKSSQLTTIEIENRQYLPVDIDTSPMDNSKSHKEGVSRTYKQFDGYHPIFCYIGREGYMVNTELREGKQHCQKGTPEFLEHTMGMISKLGIETPLLFRFDGGNDSKNILSLLERSGHFFIVKRNLRKELPEYWISVAQAEGTIIHESESKTIYTGIHTGKKPAQDDSFPAIDVIFQVTERRRAKDGTHLLFPEVEIETFWTNMYETPEAVIDLYHDHGTSEQFHSELKSDMNVERLPSGKFAVNAMLLKLAMLSFNILRFIGQTALSSPDSLPYKTTSKRKRLRKVIDDLIRIAIKVVEHARKTILRLWVKDPWLDCFRKIYQTCCNL